MRNLIQNIKFLAVAGSTFLLASGCDLGDDPASASPVSYVSIYQASPNSPDLQISLDKKKIITAFKYTDHTGYLRFISGKRKLEFGPSDASNVVADTTLTYEVGKAYSIFFVDTYDKADLMVLSDDVNAPSSGKAKLRFLNLSPDAPEVSLAESGASSDLFSGRAFKETSDFIEIAADTYSLVVKTTDGNETLLSLPNVPLLDGWSYSIIVRGYKTVPSGSTNVLSAQLIVD